jgi:hypothetical protein
MALEVNRRMSSYAVGSSAIMGSMPDPALRAMLETLDGKLAMSLAHSRASFRHAILRGDGAEYALRDSLSLHLPRSLAVGTGEAIDITNARSGQVDVVIANDAQPFRTDIDDPGLFLIEGVSAAGEVKANLTTDRLDSTIEAATLFKELRSADRGSMYVSKGSDDARFLDRRPYFLFAFESQIAHETLIERLDAALPVNGADGTGAALVPIDAVFILGEGVAINCGDGAGVLRYQHESGPQAGDAVTGWMWSGQDSGIFTYFLLWLGAVMPRIEYARPIVTNYLIRAMGPNENE